MRKIKWMGLVCGLLALAWASDSTMAGDNGSVVRPNGQGGGETDEVTAEVEKDVVWAKMGWNLEGKIDTVDALSMTVESACAEDLALAFRLQFNGLETEEILDLGTYALAAKSAIVIDVPAGELPIQNLNGATIVTPRITGTIVSNAAAGRIVSIPAPGILYRFNDQSYTTLTVFTRQALEEDLHGIMFEGGSAADAPESIVLGRVKKNGKLANLKADDDKFTVKKNGKIEARLLSSGMVIWADMTEEEKEREKNHEKYMETSPDTGEEP